MRVHGRITAVAALVAVSLLLGACGSSGGPLDAAALDTQATTLHGLAGEGSVMATATEAGHLLGPYRRVHSRELADEAGLAALAEAADGPGGSGATSLDADGDARRPSPPLAAPTVDAAQAQRANDAFERTAASTSS